MWNRKFIPGIVMAVLAVALVAMFVVAAESPAGRAEFLVPKITCGACSATISDGLNLLPGVESVQVDVSNTLVKVAYDEKLTNPGELALELGRLGYPGRLVAHGGSGAAGATAPKVPGRGGCGGGCCDKKPS